jgi:hypothetical protein
VLAALGSGFWFVQQNVSPEAAEGFFIIGVLALSLGVGIVRRQRPLIVPSIVA